MRVNSNIIFFLLRTSPPSPGGDTLGLGTPATLRGLGATRGRLWGWALQGDSGAGHSGDTLGLGTIALVLGTPRETLRLGTPGLGTPAKFWGGRIWGWALQAHDSEVGTL